MYLSAVESLFLVGAFLVALIAHVTGPPSLLLVWLVLGSHVTHTLARVSVLLTSVGTLLRLTPAHNTHI